MNRVKLNLLTAICIATAFTFSACEEKGKGAVDPNFSIYGVWENAETKAVDAKGNETAADKGNFQIVIRPDNTIAYSDIGTLDYWYGSLSKTDGYKYQFHITEKTIYRSSSEQMNETWLFTYNPATSLLRYSNGKTAHYFKWTAAEYKEATPDDDKSEAEELAEEGCPDGIGPLQAEAVFLSSYMSDMRHRDVAKFRLANGNEIDLLYGCENVHNMNPKLKEGDKVSITYKNEKYCWGDPDVGDVCDDTGTLKSLKIIKK